MTQREKLIELLEWHYDVSHELTAAGIENLADYLIANGVVVVSCNVGDTVYQHDGVRVYESKITRMIYVTDAISFDSRAVGESIFLTREEAEKALEKRKGGDEW